MAQKEDEKVKVVYHNDPSRTRFVTRQAAKYLEPKWVQAEDQTGAPSPNGQKKVAAAPVESTIDKKAELREKYNELTGEEAKQDWNEARLFVEIQKATVKAKAKAEEPVEEVKVEEAVATPAKRKYNKKAKTETTA